MLLPPKPPEPEQQKAPEQTAQAEEKKDVKKDKKKDLPQDATQRKAVLQQRVASKGLLKILGSAGGSGALSGRARRRHRLGRHVRGAGRARAG